MATSDKSCLVTSIMLHVIDKVDSDLLVPIQWFPIKTKVGEHLVFVNLTKLQCLSILPACVTILAVQFKSLIMVARNVEAILLDRSSMVGLELGLIDQM